MTNDAHAGGESGGGGFAVVLGNPPWERVKLQEKEFFSERDPAIAAAPNAAARKRAIEALLTTNPGLLDEFHAASRKAEGESHLIRNTGRYPLCGRGDVNTYTIFAESMRDAIGRSGRIGVIVPSGIATDDTTKHFFRDLIDTDSLVSLYDFENRAGIFPDVDSRYKFCLLTLRGSSLTWNGSSSRLSGAAAPQPRDAAAHPQDSGAETDVSGRQRDVSGGETPLFAAQRESSAAQRDVLRKERDVFDAHTRVSSAQTPLSSAQTPLSSAQTPVSAAQTRSSGEETRSSSKELRSSSAPARDSEAQFAFFLHAVSDLSDRARVFTLSAEDIALLNPNTRTCPIFRTRRDAEITKAIYRRVPVLIREGDPDGGGGRAEVNPWGVKFSTMFHMSNDSHLFRTREQLQAEGFTLQGNIFRKGEETWLPLYEAKYIHQFEHRHADCTADEIAANQAGAMSAEDRANPHKTVLPRYWVSALEVHRAAPTAQKWFIGFRDVTRATDFRTCTFTVLPVAAVGHTMPLIFLRQSASLAACWIANANSYAQDYFSRHRLGGIHLTFFIVEQLALFAPSTYEERSSFNSDLSIHDWLLPRVLELTYTAWDLQPFAIDCGLPPDHPPFVWDEERRFHIRCELDAAFFHLYGIGRDDAAYIMDTFPIVKRKDEQKHGTYRTKDMILSIYDEMAAAPQGAYQTKLDPPPGDPRAAHNVDA